MKAAPALRGGLFPYVLKSKERMSGMSEKSKTKRPVDPELKWLVDSGFSPVADGGSVVWTKTTTGEAGSVRATLARTGDGVWTALLEVGCASVIVRFDGGGSTPEEAFGDAEEKLNSVWWAMKEYMED